MGKLYRSPTWASGDATLTSIAEALDYLVAFNRGQHIAKNLSQLWLMHGTYVGAREALDDALAQEQLFSAHLWRAESWQWVTFGGRASTY